MPEDPMESPLRPSEAATLVLAFVNTRPLDGAAERLADGATTRAWLVEAGVLGESAVVTDADAAAARELRAALVAVLLAHSGEPADVAAEAHLRRSAELHPVLPVVSVAGAALPPAQTGVPGAFGRILGAAVELALDGRWVRLKACRNPPCHAGFYDRTRNTSALYCTPRRCGAQVSMRAHRARQAR